MVDCRFSRSGIQPQLIALQYWVVFAFFTVIESFINIVYWFPFYFVFKFVFFLAAVPSP